MCNHDTPLLPQISAPHSLLDGECGSVGGSVSSERAIDVGRVAAWATSFEKLLEDPAGLHTFAVSCGNFFILFLLVNDKLLLTFSVHTKFYKETFLNNEWLEFI